MPDDQLRLLSLLKAALAAETACSDLCHELDALPDEEHVNDAAAHAALTMLRTQIGTLTRASEAARAREQRELSALKAEAF